MTEEKRKSLHPDSKHLVRAYNILQDKGEVTFPVFDEQIFNLDVIAKTVNAKYFGIVRFPTPEHQASAYFCFIIKDHPMTDGNKRLAVLWLEIFSGALNIRINENVKLDVIAVAVEQEKTMQMDNIINTVKNILFG